MRAVCLLRDALHYRRDAFCRGLQAAGYRLEREIERPEPGDVLVIWNRYGGFHAKATRFEQQGGTVLVAENGYLGKGWQGGDWYALARGHHAGAGWWPVGGPERWAEIGTELAPWRQGTLIAPFPGELPTASTPGNPRQPLVLGQRGIGEPGIASPAQWAERVQAKVGGRIRPHPGKHGGGVSLAKDLAGASCVLTWHSSAAFFALLAGVPVFHAFPRWIGSPASQPIERYPVPRQDDGRLAMFQSLAWAMWRLDEIAGGEAFVALRG